MNYTTCIFLIWKILLPIRKSRKLFPSKINSLEVFLCYKTDFLLLRQCLLHWGKKDQNWPILINIPWIIISSLYYHSKVLRHFVRSQKKAGVLFHHIHDMHHCKVFWRPSSWLVVSDVKSANTSLATNRLLDPWCNVKWCISWIAFLICIT